jgi:hypothetical protein
MPESGKRMETRNDITARLEVQRHCSITKPVVALLPLQVNPNWTMGAAAAWPPLGCLDCQRVDGWAGGGWRREAQGQGPAGCCVGMEGSTRVGV